MSYISCERQVGCWCLISSVLTFPKDVTGVDVEFHVARSLTGQCDFTPAIYIKWFFFCTGLQGFEVDWVLPSYAVGLGTRLLCPRTSTIMPFCPPGHPEQQGAVSLQSWLAFFAFCSCESKRHKIPLRCHRPSERSLTGVRAGPRPVMFNNSAQNYLLQDFQSCSSLTEICLRGCLCASIPDLSQHFLMWWWWLSYLIAFRILHVMLMQYQLSLHWPKMAESCTDSVMLKHGITAAGMCAWLHPAAAMGCSTAAMVLARGQLPGRRNPCHKVGYLLGLWETRSTQALLLSEAQCGCWCCAVSLSLRTHALRLVGCFCAVCSASLQGQGWGILGLASWW